MHFTARRNKEIGGNTCGGEAKYLFLWIILPDKFLTSRAFNGGSINDKWMVIWMT